MTTNRDLIISEGCLVNKRRRLSHKFTFWFRLSGGDKTSIRNAAEAQNYKLAIKAAERLEEVDDNLRTIRAAIKKATGEA